MLTRFKRLLVLWTITEVRVQTRSDYFHLPGAGSASLQQAVYVRVQVSEIYLFILCSNVFMNWVITAVYRGTPVL